MFLPRQVDEYSEEKALDILQYIQTNIYQPDKIKTKVNNKVGSQCDEVEKLEEAKDRNKYELGINRKKDNESVGGIDNIESGDVDICKKSGRGIKIFFFKQKTAYEIGQ